jgi:hypothetical protein
MSDRNIPSKDDLANHVRIYTGRLFYDGSYTDEQRWVKAELFEALRERLTVETTTPQTCQCGQHGWGPDYHRIIDSNLNSHYADRRCELPEKTNRDEAARPVTSHACACCNERFDTPEARDTHEYQCPRNPENKP